MATGGSPAGEVCVIIAAYRAAATIARAVASALAEAEVAEVIVVDDASPDATGAATRAADDGSGRLRVIRLDRNAGPSRARNRAIGESTAPYLSILDADDFVLPGRYAALLASRDWDMIADNIAFVDEAAADRFDPSAVRAHRAPARELSPAAFVAGCLTRRDRYKGELGFLKPVLSRAFLDPHGLRYDEGMRLAEDFDLYVRALAAGARFRLIGECGYVAVERAGSLSGEHRTEDLARYESAIGARLDSAPGDPAFRDALRRLLAQTARKRRHRELLDRKRELGLARALAGMASDPPALAAALADVLRDKLSGLRRPPPPRAGVRFLF